MSDLPDPVTLAIPGFILLMIAEIVIMRRRGSDAYETRDTATSLMLGFGSTLAGLLSAGLIYAMADAAHAFGADTLRLPQFGFAWWVWPLCFVADDFAYYLFHRSAHRVRWFWAAHVVHHSSQHYNLSTALRQTWTGFFALAFIFRLPLFLVFPPAMVFFCAGLNLVYQFWIHTEAVRRMPRWFEAVMNTPSHHRVHHGTNARYLDRNYAGVFIVWDRLLGTFEAERDDERIHYGLVHNLGSFNLLWAAFHEWAGIMRDIWHAPWRHKLGYLWREPGWSHDGSRETSATIRARWEDARAKKAVDQAPESR
ncbi:sterol desaturase family protein [Novosphingopyxis iocasae]|uniref:sterol desaturase family protein n=1 Tax=Novosphingopyxis iocasae TaxID=2762729 RepID=UPI001650FBC1|nr:sterol desaturase family protein [Novosphingopyxis iocasae]